MKKIIGIFIMTLMIFSTSATANILVQTVETEQYSLVTSTNEDIIEMIEQMDENLFLSYLEDLVAFGPKLTNTIACEEAGDYIYNEFENMDLEVRFQEWDYEGYSGKNVEATLYGMKESSDEIYIICAHYDTVRSSPGADDDGSGVAAVMSAASIISSYSFNHTIRFVTFSGEEQGLYGSHEYAREAYENNDNIKAVLNVDMIGYGESDFECSNICIFENIESQWLTDFIDSTSKQYYDFFNISVNRLGPLDRSDHDSFWEFGYDGVQFIEMGNNPYYHKSSDIIENMNIDYAVRNSKLILASLAGISDSNICSIPEKPIISGSEEGEIGEELSFSTSTIDPYGKQLSYIWDWGDGSQSDWIGPFDSGLTISELHIWDEDGIYQIRVKAKNSDGLESDWSNPFIIGIPKKNDGIDQQQTKFGNMGYGAYGVGQLAQSFKPTMDTITKASLYLFKQGEPNGIWVSIRSDLNGCDLTSEYLSGDDIEEELKGVWFEFDFPDIEVTPGQTYYIIWTADELESGNSIYWLFGNDNPYSDGHPWSSVYGSWEEFEIPDSNNGDFCFKTYHAKPKIKSISIFSTWFEVLIERFPILELLL